VRELNRPAFSTRLPDLVRRHSRCHQRSRTADRWSVIQKVELNRKVGRQLVAVRTRHRNFLLAVSVRHIYSLRIEEKLAERGLVARCFPLPRSVSIAAVERESRNDPSAIKVDDRVRFRERTTCRVGYELGEGRARRRDLRSPAKEKRIGGCIGDPRSLQIRHRLPFVLGLQIGVRVRNAQANTLTIIEAMIFQNFMAPPRVQHALWLGNAVT
jgi:hypothetical protein